MAASGEDSAAAVPALASDASAPAAAPVTAAAAPADSAPPSPIVKEKDASPASYSPTGWPAFSQGYKRLGYIGEGAYASVYRAQCCSGDHKGMVCAIKVLNLEQNKTPMDVIAREVETMKLCKHENVLELHAAFNVMEELWLVMPFMNKGSVKEIIRDRVHKMKRTKSKELPLTESDIQIFIRATCAGLNYLHSHGWVHRDIKAANILVDHEGHIKIADFGVANLLVDYDVVHGTRQIASTWTGTPCWMAPEVMKQDTGYSNKADIWSLGITTLELAKTYAPYANEPTMTVLMKTMNSDPPNIKTYEEYEKSGSYKVDFKPSRSMKSFLPRMLHKNPEKRNTAVKLLSCNFLKNAPTPSIAGASPNAAWQRFRKMLDSVCSVEDKKEPEPQSHSGKLKLAHIKVREIKRRCRQRALAENISIEDAIRSVFEEGLANRGMVEKLIQTQLKQEMSPPKSEEGAAAATAAATDTEEATLLDSKEAAVFVDPDRTEEQSFLTAEPAMVAKAVQKITGATSAPIPEVPEETASSVTAIEEQLMAMESGTPETPPVTPAAKSSFAPATTPPVATAATDSEKVTASPSVPVVEAEQKETACSVASIEEQLMAMESGTS